MNFYCLILPYCFKTKSIARGNAIKLELQFIFSMSKLLITNIKGLVQVENEFREKVCGKEMGTLPVLENSFLLMSDGLIADFGPMENCPEIDAEKIDATGQFVFPSYVDSHTHLVYAGSREAEFGLRIKGATYEEIAKAGGGILNSAKRVQESTEEELFDSAHKRLMEVISQGTGAIEIKSGYGLSTTAELKMLRVIKELKKVSPITIKASFLGAHAYPLEFKENHLGYLNLIAGNMLPKIASEGLADYIDVFCDRGFFSAEETDFLLSKGAEYGLRPRIHANELDYSGGIQVGVKYKALSVDHLEFTGDAEIQCLLNSSTMPTLLPTTAFFLHLHYPPARKMIDAGLPVSLASDYNPGSSPSGNMNFVLSLACIYLKMTPEEAINAATINAAYSLELQKTHGTIARGKIANVFITKKVPSYQFLPYSFGQPQIETIILNGKVVQANQSFS
jgi:imidazolonepropionase